PETVPEGARFPGGDGRLPEPVGGRACGNPRPRVRARRTRRRPAEEAGGSREGPRQPRRDQAPVHEELKVGSHGCTHAGPEGNRGLARRNITISSPQQQRVAEPATHPYLPPVHW